MCEHMVTSKSLSLASALFALCGKGSGFLPASPRHCTPGWNSWFLIQTLFIFIKENQQTLPGSQGLGIKHSSNIQVFILFVCQNHCKGWTRVGNSSATTADVDFVLYASCVMLLILLIAESAFRNDIISRVY